MKKLLVMILLTTIIATLIPGCGNTPGETQLESITTATIEETSKETLDSLPEDLNFDGATFTVWGREVDNVFYTSEWEFSEEITGEKFSDELYQRELKVEGRLNVNIEKTLTNLSFQNAYNSVMAGEYEFDMLFANAYDVAPHALEGVYFDLAQFPYIDYDMPWWPDTIMEDVTINGKTYFITGDITPSVLGFMNCIFFNKNIAENYDISGLYDLVFSGKWTFDKYAETAKMVYNDLNGNGEADDGDLYGITTSDYYDVYFSAFEIPLTNTNADGSLSLALGEKFYNAYSKLREMSMDISSLPQSVSNKGESVNYSNDVNFFAQGQVLFFGGLLRFSDYFRAMEDDYGVLTVPKWDESQDEYHTTSHANYSLLSIPVTVPEERHEMVGAVIEALASEGYRSTTPAYFDSTLKDKYSRDEETFKVLDILRTGLEFQPVMIYYKSMGDLLHLFRYACYPQPTYDNMVSFYESKVQVFQNAIDKFNEAYAD